MTRYRRTKKLAGATVALITTAALLALGSPAAMARWQVHNDADITQIVAPPGGDDTQTCADEVVAQAAFALPVPITTDPESLRPPAGSRAYGFVGYGVWKAPVNDPLGRFTETVPGSGVIEFEDSSGTLLPTTLVSPAGYSTPARAAVPAQPLYPPIDPTSVTNLYYYSLADFTVPLTGVSNGDLLGIKPVGGGSTFINLTAVDCSPQPVTARIDVLPGSTSNVILPQVKAPVLPVLVYGSSSLNVRSIVESSVRLQNAPAAYLPAILRRPFDADHDGFLDRLYFFSPRSTGITCGQTSVTLTGQTNTGIGFSGTNPIRTVCH